MGQMLTVSRLPDAGHARLEHVSETWFTEPASAVVAEFDVDTDTGLTAARVVRASGIWPQRASGAGAALGLGDHLLAVGLAHAADVDRRRRRLVPHRSDLDRRADHLAGGAERHAGARQEIKARSSVDALAAMQVPTARVRRAGALVEVPASELVPGDVVLLEAGDLVPADGRILTSARLEAAESSLTGERAGAQGCRTGCRPGCRAGDRSSMLFQNTLLTWRHRDHRRHRHRREHRDGSDRRHAARRPGGSPPLQLEVRGLTIRLSIVAWIAVAIIVVLGLFRGLDTDAVILLGITTAISSIPSGLPTFLNGMLSFGAQRLAKAQAVVKTLNDVETLGCTSAINSDKTGTLTMDMMTATRMYTGGHWYAIEGTGYSTTGAILKVAGTALPDWTLIGYGLALSSDAVVNDDGTIVGDPTEAALVVLGAKMGIDARESRRAYPRIAEVPFDSAYKFMATVHTAPVTDGDDVESVVMLVKGCAGRAVGALHVGGRGRRGGAAGRSARRHHRRQRRTRRAGPAGDGVRRADRGLGPA